jgi:hypothetical protein
MKTSLITAALALLALLFLSCTVTTAPDGKTTRTPDYNAWLEITRLILADETPQPPFTPSK